MTTWKRRMPEPVRQMSPRERQITALVWAADRFENDAAELVKGRVGDYFRTCDPEFHVVAKHLKDAAKDLKELAEELRGY